jgi:hypothetical protein
MRTLLIFEFGYPGGTAFVRKLMLPGEEIPKVGDVVQNVQYEDQRFVVRVDEVQDGVPVGDALHIKVIGKLQQILPKVNS